VEDRAQAIDDCVRKHNRQWIDVFALSPSTFHASTAFHPRPLGARALSALAAARSAGRRRKDRRETALALPLGCALGALPLAWRLAGLRPAGSSSPASHPAAQRADLYSRLSYETLTP
jgi:hypothetical protein